MKRGLGLMEVLVAALVLAFLLIGLNLLQKGNRESILRIRARDAANVVAQEIIDSISAIGSASVQTGTYEDIKRERVFTNVTIPFFATVSVKHANDIQIVDNSTEFMKALRNSGSTNNLSVAHQFAKHIEVSVYWKFKNSDQSVNVSSVLR